jgi:hypothetical protein
MATAGDVNTDAVGLIGVDVKGPRTARRGVVAVTALSDASEAATSKRRRETGIKSDIRFRTPCHRE